MPGADPCLDLLIADVARTKGRADARHVAAALKEVLALPRVQRPSLLEAVARHAGWDAETADAVRREVDELLEASGGSPRRALIRRGGPAASLVPPTPRGGEGPSATSAAGLREMARGRYEDFEPVGQGGMGIVYWAVDRELHRQVALKVVRPPGGAAAPGITPPAPLGITPPEASSPAQHLFEGLSARLLQEAWVTGGMEHPGVPPVYELGKTDAGVPYYTMRFIRGSRTLATAIEDVRTQDIERRLDLLEPFLRVCDTVRYAHSRGVMHRDLKPENVALGDYGETVVIDWGLARPLGTGGGAHSGWSQGIEALRGRQADTDATVVGTPGFIPPEALDDPAEGWSERGDVFSLGVMLFEILTGVLPYRSASLREYASDMLATGASDPSRVASGVPAPLASLCTRMLAPGPRDRPEGADEVAAAIRGWQAQARRDSEAEGILRGAETMLATADDLHGASLLRRLDEVALAGRRALELKPGDAAAERLLVRVERDRARGLAERERAARRHALRRAAVAAMLALGIGAAVVAGLLERRRREAETARGEADAARTRAEGVMTFMVGDLKEALEPLGRLDLLAHLAEQSEAYYESLPLEGSSIESLRNRARALRNLGEVHHARGDLSRAIRTYDLAAAVAQRLVQRRPQDTDARYQESLAAALRGRALLDQGYGTNALAFFQEHVALMQEILDREPGSDAYALALARALEHLSTGRRFDGRADEALEASEQALDLARTRRATSAEDPAAWSEQEIRAQLQTALNLLAQSRYADAGTRAQAALALAERADLARREEARWQGLTAAAHTVLGLVESRNQDTTEIAAWERALEHFAPAEKTHAGLTRRDDQNLRLREQHAASLRRMGDALWGLERRAEARAAFEQAFGILDALVAADPSNARWKHRTAAICDRLCHGLKDEARVLRLRTRAATLADQLHERDPGNRGIIHLQAYTQARLAHALSAAEAERAVTTFERALRLGESVLDATAPEPSLVILLGQSSVQFARCLQGLGRLEDGIEVLERDLARVRAARARLPGAHRLRLPEADTLVALAALVSKEGGGGRERAIALYREVLRGIEAAHGDPAVTPGLRDRLAGTGQRAHAALEALGG